MLVLLAACGRPAGSASSGNAQWVDTAVQRIRPIEQGWNFSGFSGGSAPDGSWYQFSITPDGKSAGQAVEEFKTALKEQLSRGGFAIKGQGGGSSSDGTSSFALRVESGVYRGTIMVVFHPTGSAVSGTMAIAQIPRS